ncbi:LPS export ABC transporter periplasmic protein LptC [Lysobacter fragariae]
MSWRGLVTILLMVGAVISAWSVWKENRKEAVATTTSARSDYVLVDFELVSLNPQGKESFTLRAPHLARDPSKKTIDVATPLFLIPPGADNSDAWQVRSKSAWVSEGGDEVRLRGNVKGVSEGAGVPTTLETQELNVFPEAKRAASPTKVVITRPGSILSGRGLKLSLATKKYSFNSEVHHVYVPNR